MNKVNKKGFTIVELVIVLAVIGILAGILIPTFANVIRKSQISADVQLAKNLNTVLATAAAEGRIPTSMYDVLYLENEAGYIIENLNPTNQDYYFAWDSANNKIVYLMDDLVTVFYPEEYQLDVSTCWITVGSAAEAMKVADKGYNLALEKSIDETIVLNNAVSVDTLGFTVQDLKFDVEGTASVDSYVTLTGNFTDISGSIGSANVVQSGSASSISLTGSNSSSVTVGGYVNNFSATGSTATVSSTGMIKTVDATSSASIENNGVVQTNNGSSQVQENTTQGNTVTINNKEGLESVRMQLTGGSRTFKGETIVLSDDINMSGIAFRPLSNNWRKDEANKDTWFQGTFDGAGYAIQGFSNNGFNINGLNIGTNSSSVSFANAGIYDECVYGLFGTVYASERNDVVIKNLTVNCSISMECDSSTKRVGDSVGGIIGYAYGADAGTIRLENCKVTGSILGYDGVGGLVGRAYHCTLEFVDCVNQASVTGVRKTAGFCGSISSTTIKFTNCKNEGNITCLGLERDNQLGASGASKGNGYYKAAPGWVGGNSNDNWKLDLTNTGTIKIAGGGAGDKDPTPGTSLGY